MWTKEKVLIYLDNINIHTAGALNPYKHSDVKYGEDGDSWWEVDYPFWQNNDSVMRDVLNLCRFMLDIADTRISIRENPNKHNDFHDIVLRIYFYESICDPD